MFKKSSVISGTLLVILAACSTAFAQGEGDRYVLGSLNTLLTANTIESEIRIATFVDGGEYTARGHYEEQALPRIPGQSPPFLRSMHRLEIFFINTPMAGSAETNRMTLVSRPGTDGGRGQMERYTSIEGVRTFHTIDLTVLEERIRNSRAITFTQVSEVRNLGGLAGKMRQIGRFYAFSAPTQEILQDGETIPTLRLTGRLRSEHYEWLLAHFGGLDARGRYPVDFPSDIELWLGRHNDFPYQIRYLRRISPDSERKELLLQETFFNVVLNGAPIPAARFAPLIPPDDVFGVDGTDDLIRTLGL